MNKKYIPVMLMLVGGLVTVVITFVNNYSIIAKLGWLLAVMAVLYFVGSIVINIIQRFEDANQKKLEEEELVKVREDETIELLGYKGLLVQKSKFRFFYLDKNGYDTIIEKIRRDISHNTSEFGFLPEQAVSDITEDILQFAILITGEVP